MRLAPAACQELSGPEIIARLIQAEATFAALPLNAPRLGIRVATFGYLPEATEAAQGSEKPRNRRPTPSPEAIDLADATLGWLPAITDEGQRRAVKARMKIDATTGRPPTWTALAETFDVEWKTVKARHDRGIRKIIRHLKLGTVH